MSRATQRQEQNGMVLVREATDADADHLGLIMYNAIHEGRSAYTLAQRQAWQSAPNSGPEWAARLASQQVWLAEEASGPTAFISLGAQGYVDLAFVAAASQGRGVFRVLYEALETYAVNKGCSRLWTHASLTVQRAFEACGFCVIRHETVPRAGQTLARAQMEKLLK
ncbi:MAG: GNAT family N-acetyltransferase [Tateyamaria sp.]|nr:GNAT family N-acetyltransferase [Tateyamaria sp.]